MTRFMIALPLGLATLAAGPAFANDLRDQVRAGVAERTEARLEARDTLPPGQAAEARIASIDARLDWREEVNAQCLRPDVRLIRRGTRIDARLTE